MKNIFIILVILCGSIIGQPLNKSITATQKTIGGANEIGEYNFVEYSVKSNVGKELYKIVDKVDYDIPYSKLEVFSDGSSVLISSFYGTLTFISNDGTKTKSVKIKDNIKAKYERSIKSVSDKNILVVLLSEQNKSNSTIQRYNSSGNIINSFLVNITGVNGIAYSKSINQLYLSHIKWKNSGELDRRVTLLNSNGEVVKRFNTNFEKGFFTEDNIFVGVSNKSVFSFNTTKLELGYKIDADKKSILIDVTVIDSKLVVAQAENPELQKGEWYYKNPTIIKFNSAGKVIEKINLKTELFSEYKFQKSNTNLEFVVGKKSIVIDWNYKY